MSVVDIFFLTSVSARFCPLSIGVEKVSLLACFSSSVSLEILPGESVGGTTFVETVSTSL